MILAHQFRQNNYMSSSFEDLLHHIEEAHVRGVRRKPGVIQSGPFLISLHPTDDLVWLNNAVVNDNGHAIEQQDVEGMIDVFLTNKRVPRMEIFREIRGDLVEILIDNGFSIESEMPVMVCTAETFLDRPFANVSVELLNKDSDPMDYIRIADAAFEHTAPVTPQRIERTRQSIRSGSQRSAVASLNGIPAAVATLVVSDSVAELAGVGTLDQYRRKGAASAASAHLMRGFFSNGGKIIWLSAGDATAQAVYEKLGFQLTGTQVNISRASY